MHVLRTACLLLVCVLSAVPPGFAAGAATTHEELILFVRSSAEGAIIDGVETTHRPALESLAGELGLRLRVVDTAEQAPAEVHLTPLLVYQSARGRAVFQGRYVDTGKVAHFVRTQRAVPPQPGGYTAKNVAVASLGRAQVSAPIKITGLSGHLPEGLDADSFTAEARAAILAGFQRFSERESIELGAADRAFYMDFHPYLDEAGRLWVSTALFSQFNCIEPVFVGEDTPHTGSWDERDRVFAAAARQLENEVMAQITGSTRGDGFDPVPATVAEVSWEQAGLPLPERAQGSSAAAANLELPARWRVEPSEPGAAPRLVFRFPAPLDRYTGEVGQVDGALALESPDSLQGAKGWIETDTSSVTMGEQTLDAAIHGKMILVKRFPDARFELAEVSAPEEPLRFGNLSRVAAKGTFTMMGQEIPLDVAAQLEPIVGDDGKPRLHVQAGFEIRLMEPFGVEGPDGPAPANDTLQFHLDVLMLPDS
ncbi:hypothetical protein ABI59_07790 [Acidobacteria bacterium Mor1]|nr:hypothetical protein ABI59_07790 [Acidobacteria bacterium Mor1]